MLPQDISELSHALFEGADEVSELLAGAWEQERHLGSSGRVR